MLTAAVPVKSNVFHSSMDLPFVYDENSLLQCKREEQIYPVYQIMEEHTFLQKYISRGSSRSDQ